jgi:predicted hydrocarbon binding protein
MTDRKNLMIANALMLQALKAIEEVMGKKGLDAVLHNAGLDKYIDHFPPNDVEPAISSTDYAGLNQAIEEFYGRGGKGILKRIGRASFQYGVREQAALLGLAGLALKVLPKRQRVKFIFNSIGSALKKINHENEYFVDDRSEHLAYITPTCSICYGRHHEQPVCHVLVGSLSEAAKWATWDDLEIRETHCMSKGDKFCRFEVMMQG